MNPPTIKTSLPASLATQKKPLLLTKVRNWPKTHHFFDIESIWAVNTALHTGRPLLLRGEPGCGKSQLARAAAQELGRTFLSRVVNARMEPEDLLYRYDAVSRLAHAQLRASSGQAGVMPGPECFLVPEILWWAIHPGTAAKYHSDSAKYCNSAAEPYANTGGAVVLIDEIDKADSDVPNSLLEALSLDGFQLPFGAGAITRDETLARPLIIMTTNEDRELPPAFLRRCLVHQMDPPKDREERKAAFFRKANAHPASHGLDPALIHQVIDLLEEDREKMERLDLPKPGLAELLVFLNALGSAQAKEEPKEALKIQRKFSFEKHRTDF